MQVGRFLIMCTTADVFSVLPANEESRRPLEKRLYLLGDFLEKFGLAVIA